MFKAVLFVTLCIFVLTECRPPRDSEQQFIGEHSRVERSPQHAQNAMKLAGQMANEGIQASGKGLGILSSAAQHAISAGASIAAEAMKTAGSMI